MNPIFPIDFLKKVVTMAPLVLFCAAIFGFFDNSSASHLSDGQKYFFRSDYQNAMKSLQKAREKEAENPILWYLMGRCFIELGDSQLAKQAFEEAVKLKWDYSLARLYLARICYQMADIPCAATHYTYLERNHRRELEEKDAEIIAQLRRKKSTAPAALPVPAIPAASAGPTPAAGGKGEDTKSPQIVLLKPTVTRGVHVVDAQTAAPSDGVAVSGLVIDESGILRVKINGKPIRLSKDNKFNTRVAVNPGENLVHITAVDRRGNTADKEFVIVRSSESMADATGGSVTAEMPDFSGQRYFALIIAVSDYDDSSIPDLQEPLKDARDLEHMLVRSYSFDPKRLLFLRNPKRSRLVNAFYGLAKTIGKNDNLLVFFAGHGVWDADMEIGYWLARDAKKDDRSTWISNTVVRDFLGGIKSRHTLLIADACFSGGIFRTRSVFDQATPAISQLYRLKSRKAMSSGTLSEVPDNSVFVKYLLRRLADNPQKYISAQELFSQFRRAVINNSMTHQVPQYGTVHGCGDEGGDFIFVRSR